MFIQVRRGTTPQWEASNRVLLAGEWGAAIDSGQITSLRMGNGVDLWADLPEQRAPTVHVSTQPPTASDGQARDWWLIVDPTP